MSCSWAWCELPCGESTRFILNHKTFKSHLELKHIYSLQAVSDWSRFLLVTYKSATYSAKGVFLWRPVWKGIFLIKEIFFVFEG